MKVAVINDLHFGVRGDREIIFKHQETFFDKCFFPTLEKNKIKTVWILGDLVDRRKYININTLSRMKKMFLDRLSNYDVHLILGNHDVYFKNTLTPNSAEELLLGYKNIKIYDSPMVVPENPEILVVPWICHSNEQSCYEAIRSSRARICFGHFEISGFKMNKGSFCSEGMSIKTFDKFSSVLTGHFHHKSDYNNIHYLGSPYQMTWVDYGSVKGFHLFDTETTDLEFIENKNNYFLKIPYDDEKWTSTDDISKIDLSYCKDCFVRVIIKNKSNPYWYDLFMDVLEESGAEDIQVVEDHFNLSLETDHAIVDQAEDTLTILRKYIETLESGENSEKLLMIMKDLYDRATLVRA